MRILKSYGAKGGLLVSAASLSEDFNKKEPVFIEFDGLPVPFFIEEIKSHGSTKLFIKLEDIDTLEDAEALVGKDILLEEEYSSSQDSIIGYTLIDASTGKTVGTVTGFEDIPGNPCIEVEKSLFPCHEDLIRKIDRKKRVIFLTIPEGLL
ncbi:MAG: hypothetical protein J6Z27_04080 [Bacteroidales bacterium]|nr:hypothetical protein [Bacteroidales bacterium]